MSEWHWLQLFHQMFPFSFPREEILSVNVLVPHQIEESSQLPERSDATSCRWFGQRDAWDTLTLHWLDMVGNDGNVLQGGAPMRVNDTATPRHSRVTTASFGPGMRQSHRNRHQCRTTMLTTHEPDVMTKDSRRRPIIRAIMHFLTAHRSEEERRALKEKLSSCRCNLRDPAVKRLHLGDPTIANPDLYLHEVVPPDFNTALMTICDIILRGLRARPVGKLRAIRRNTAAEAQPWPSTQHDIIGPDGASETVSALLYGYGVFVMLGAMGRFWEPFALTIFRMPQAFSLVTDHIEFALDHYDAHAAEAVVMKRILHHASGAGPKGNRYGHGSSTPAHGAHYTSDSADPVRYWPDGKRHMEELDEQLRIPRDKYPASHYLILPTVVLVFVGGSALIVFKTVKTLTRIVLILLLIVLIFFLTPIVVGHRLRRRSSPSTDFQITMLNHLVQSRNTNKFMYLKCTHPIGVKTAVYIKCGIRYACPPPSSLPFLTFFPLGSVNAARGVRHISLTGPCDAIHTLRAVLQLEDSAEWDSWVLRTKATGMNMAPHRDSSHFEGLCGSNSQLNADLPKTIALALWELTKAKREQLAELERERAEQQ
ncbi:hypothetical protein FB451DRAFT_1171967 [Mycena latifolia]|nr:hypothetical protein FB451DRAFT_1171967 [Mycena latifolia]